MLPYRQQEGALLKHLTEDIEEDEEEEEGV